ncbi:MAG TPA: hypothetical protein VGH16_18555 [Candidatus Binatia bacterium]|jgi:hypothetical protein
MDAIFILLTPEWLDAFLYWAPIGSAVSLAVLAAADITRTMRNTPYRFMMKCDEAVAGDLERIAAEHCPEAIKEIKDALRAYRRKPRKRIIFT